MFSAVPAFFSRDDIGNGLLHRKHGVFVTVLNLGIGLQPLDTLEHVVCFGLVEELLHVCIAVSVAAQQRSVEFLDEVFSVLPRFAVDGHRPIGVDHGVLCIQRCVLVLNACEKRLIVLGQRTVKKRCGFALDVLACLLRLGVVRQQ